MAKKCEVCGNKASTRFPRVVKRQVKQVCDTCKGNYPTVVAVRESAAAPPEPKKFEGCKQCNTAYVDMSAKSLAHHYAGRCQ